MLSSFWTFLFKTFLASIIFFWNCLSVFLDLDSVFHANARNVCNFLPLCTEIYAYFLSSFSNSIKTNLYALVYHNVLKRKVSSKPIERFRVCIYARAQTPQTNTSDYVFGISKQQTSLFLYKLVSPSNFSNFTSAINNPSSNELIFLWA